MAHSIRNPPSPSLTLNLFTVFIVGLLEMRNIRIAVSCKKNPPVPCRLLPITQSNLTTFGPTKPIPSLTQVFVLAPGNFKGSIEFEVRLSFLAPGEIVDDLLIGTFDVFV